jgi:hypothetical protein
MKGCEFRENVFQRPRLNFPPVLRSGYHRSGEWDSVQGRKSMSGSAFLSTDPQAGQELQLKKIVPGGLIVLIYVSYTIFRVNANWPWDYLIFDLQFTQWRV